MLRGKKLARQITRYLGVATAEEEIAAIAAQVTPMIAAASAGHDALKNFSGFLDVIDASYLKYEENIAVAERNLALSSAELMESNHLINSMVNSLGQGFLIFGADGVCKPVFSQACVTLLETMPAGKTLAEVLRLDGTARTRLAALLKLVFAPNHAMTFDEVMRLAPQTYRHSNDRHIHLAYKPQYRDDGTIADIVAIATDVTDQIKAQTLAEEQQALFQALERILRDRRAFNGLMAQLHEVTNLPADALHAPDVRREIHTLKSTAGVFKLFGLVHALHDLETGLRHTSGDVTPLQTVFKTEVQKVAEKFAGLLGDGFEAQDAVGNSVQTGIHGFADHLRSQGHEAVRQEFLRQVCTESLFHHLRAYDVLLGDLAAKFNKQILPLRCIGADVKFIPHRYAALLRSLAHIFRNIADHGIETPMVRRHFNKAEFGCVTIALALLDETSQNPMLQIQLNDDGGGIDVLKLRSRLIAQDQQQDWAQRSDAEVLDNIFMPGMSTRDTVSVDSGRGIGMSAVRHEVEKLGGSITVASTLGAGTSFCLRVPFVLDF